jgi:hypothetical protein
MSAWQGVVTVATNHTHHRRHSVVEDATDGIVAADDPSVPT